VVRFLLVLLGWVINTGSNGGMLGVRDTYDFDGLYLFAGPGCILECYKKCDAVRSELNGVLDDDAPYSDFITHPLQSILKERGIQNYDFSSVILDSVNGGDDRCRQCDNHRESSRGIFLWNVTNWDFLKGFLWCDLGFKYLVKGQLAKNQAERGLHNILCKMDYSMLMCQLFDMRGSEYSNWAKEDWVCYNCVSEFFIDTMPFWWLERKREAGTPIMRDCWCGYDCPQQSQLKHAQQFNHLCVPTRKVPASLSSQSGYNL